MHRFHDYSRSSPSAITSVELTVISVLPIRTVAPMMSCRWNTLERIRRILELLREAEALADPRWLGQIAVFLSFHFFLSGAYDQASRQVVLYALANQYLGRAYWSQGNYRRAISCLRQTVASLEGTRCRECFEQVFLPAVVSRTYHAWCHADR